MSRLTTLIFPIGLLLVACQPDQTQLGQSTEEQMNPDPEAASNEIVLGHIDTIESSILGEERDLWIYQPRSLTDDDNENDLDQYPVVYLLDGNGHFRSVAGMLYQLGTVNGNMTVPEMIVVGFPNTDRLRDLTPTHTQGTSGGGTAFLDFIENEAIPYIESNYAASQYRTFIGHSLGGLMAVEALITRPELFTNYISIDPSLWWDDQSVLFRAEAALNEMDFSGKSLYVAVANTMRPGLTYDTIREDTGEDTVHIRSILQYSESAENNTSSGLNFDWRYYDGDDHGSVPLIAEYDALRFLFSWYEPYKGLRTFLIPDGSDEPEAVVSYVTSHFEEVSDQFGYTTLPPLSFINRFANGMRVNRPESAFALARLNLTNYPNSPITHRTIGDHFLSQGDEESARIHFQHALDRGAEFSIDERIAAQLEQSEN